MIFWLDARLPPQLASWPRERLALTVSALRDVGLRDATDETIFEAARAQSAVVITKDRDFIALVERYGPPPQVIWLTCGNTSDSHLQTLLLETWPQIRALLAANEPIVEVGDR